MQIQQIEKTIKKQYGAKAFESFKDPQPVTMMEQKEQIVGENKISPIKIQVSEKEESEQEYLDDFDFEMMEDDTENQQADLASLNEIIQNIGGVENLKEHI